MLSFSTCWNSHKHTDGAKMVHEILKLGVTKLEISHGLKISLIPGILESFKKGEFTVSGVHNFCPSPVEVMIDAPDCYEYTSDKSFDRKRAIELTKRSIETAAELHSEYIVLHLGSVPMNKYSKELEEMVSHGKIYDRQYTKLKLRSVKERESNAPLYIERANEAIDSVLETAKEFQIKLAIESRSAFEDVPNEDEMLQLMKLYQDEPLVGYWHDFGHVQRKANLGYLDHYEWLESMQPYLFGCHLHDVEWPKRDHRVPLTAGGVDFERLMPLVDYEKPVVWELSPRRRTSQIKESLETWQKLYPGL